MSENNEQVGLVDENKDDDWESSEYDEEDDSIGGLTDSEMESILHSDSSLPPSGTEKEFRDSLDGHRSKSLPADILFFFRTDVGSLDEIDPEQFGKVKKLCTARG